MLSSLVAFDNDLILKEGSYEKRKYILCHGFIKEGSILKKNIR
jgi:hypothetical protein